MRKTFFVALFLIAIPLFSRAEDLAVLCKQISETENSCQDLSAAECQATLQKCAAYYDSQSAAIAKDITKTQQQKSTLQSQVSTLKSKMLALSAILISTSLIR